MTCNNVKLVFYVLSYATLCANAGWEGLSSVLPMYTYPSTSDHLKWTEGNLEELYCPPEGYEMEAHGGYEVRRVRIGVIDEHWMVTRVKGHTCRFLSYKTVCSKGFFGSTNTRHYILSNEVDGRMCIEQIKKRINNPASNNNQFPAPSCYWMTDTTTTRKDWVLEDASVDYDPYSDSFVSPFLKDGSCKEQTCLTTHDSMIWHTESPRRSCVFRGTVVNGVYERGDGRAHYLYSDVTPPFNLQNSCRMKFCGKTGIRTGEGHFITAPFVSLVRTDCPPSTTVGYTSQSEENRWLSNEIKVSDHRLHCLSTLTRILATKKISLLDLSAFRRRLPGRGLVLRQTRNKLYVATANYMSVNLSTEAESVAQGFDKTVIGTHGGKKVISLMWNLEEGGIETNVNGIYRKGDKVFIPEAEMAKRIYNSEMLAVNDVKEIFHHEMYHPNATHDLSHIDEEDDSMKQKNIWFNFSKFFTKPLTAFLSFIVLIVFGILSLCLIKMLLRCVRSVKGKTKKVGGIELKSLKRPKSKRNMSTTFI